MPRFTIPALGLAAGLGLLLACFSAILLRDELPGYRDAAHYYYPLYLRVQQEWEAGRLPLWSAEENAGMPLLGNPTAAVLYPGKLVFAGFSYAWATRLYLIGHVALAGAGMVLLLRHWQVSRAGSILGGLSYAFGAPILFQYCNIIFLVGASWAPLGLRAADRWVRLGRRRAILELALVLAMQTLGGDPESAYLLGLCAGGYALALSGWFRPEHFPRPRRVLWLVALVIAWVGLSLLAARALAPWPERQRGSAALRPNSLWGLAVVGVDLLFDHRTVPGQAPLPWDSVPFWFGPGLWRQVVLAGWAAFGTILLRRRRQEPAATLTGRLAGLGGAALLGGLLMGVQLVPILEYTGLSVRAAEDGSHEIFPFSIEPYRAAEWIWPNVYGTSLARNNSWLTALPPVHLWKIWTPSLYLGGLTILLALSAAGLRDGPPWRAWLTVIAAVSFIGGVGMFASPLWLARNVPRLVPMLGPHDPIDAGELRRDGFFPDGFGSPYWLMAQFLPGFGGFRYPAKLLTFACLALCGLAAHGWDRLVAGHTRRGGWIGAALFTLSVILLAAAILNHDRLVRIWKAQVLLKQATTFGPFDAESAYRETLAGLGHGAIVFGLGTALVALARRRPLAGGCAAIVLTALDLAIANAGMVISVPRSSFEERPEVLRRIEEAEAREPGDGPYRIHRLPIWEPLSWQERGSGDRVRELMEWEHRTIQPKYAIPYGAQYTLTQGVAELYDYWFFFAPFHGFHDDRVGQSLGLKAGERIVYYPRRGFDLWNTRYFVLPRIPANDERRGIASFLMNARPIYPLTGTLPTAEDRRKWDKAQDWQILRNEQAFPRAWVVHSARVVPPVRGMGRAAREATMEEILYEADALWNNPNRTLFDPRSLAWIESDRRDELAAYQSGGPTGASESVRVRVVSPVRVEMDVELERPGFVILADVLYPGWKLTIDGVESPTLRANRLMRGAAVLSGRHRLVYRYEPRSLRVGAALSLAGLLGLIAAAFWAARDRAPSDGAGGLGDHSR
jgi:hypothetical protein